ncbi:MAG: NUDIX domain-containing protein [Gammaproteobacteria bacterium]|nr:NUDIX domain-containing protein [Gammaproteobacteria bacterium]
MLEIGAFPFLLKKGKIQIIIITSTSGKSWILPKGHPENHLNKSQVAELETYEEAGVKGTIINSKLRKEFKRDEDNMLIIYPLLIKDILDTWPEQDIRERRLVSIKKALNMVTKKEHIKAIKYFSTPEMIKKLTKGNLKTA